MPTPEQNMRNWRRFLESINTSRYKNIAEKFFRIAALRIGLKFKEMAQKNIRSGIFEPNSPITKILKGSSKPLFDTGQLFQAIGFEVLSAYAVLVGVKYRKVNKGGKDIDIARLVHDGFTLDLNKIPNGDKVRAALWARVNGKLKVSGEELPERPASKTPGVWVVPPRPYIKVVLEDKNFKDFVQRQWEQAWRKTWQIMVR